MQRGRLVVLGVRHHSPACARLVARTIRRLRPAAVCIEGPADLNDRLDELLLPHRLPVAVFSFQRSTQRGSYAPFTHSSPEWQALHAGVDVGAQVRFMDLPAWDKAFLDTENRYSDGARRHQQAIQRLCARFHVDGYDALWDHLFEGDDEGDEEGDEEGGDDGTDDGTDDGAGDERLQARLDEYFFALRNDEVADERDGPREALMRRFLAAALREHPDGLVVAVCGGYHAPALVDVESDLNGLGDDIEVEQPEDAFSYLVPWSHQRLDAFTGYAAGMPSPGFYDRVFLDGADVAAERALHEIVLRLREIGQRVSPADVIAAQTMIEALARLRGHRHWRRTDVLDGLAAALVKDALDVPAPWGERGVLSPSTHPLLAAVVATLSGQARGSLADGTPLPPLVHDVEQQLSAVGLWPQSGPAKTVRLALGQGGQSGQSGQAEDTPRTQSRLLHRVRLLGLPGFQRQGGPNALISTPPAASKRSADEPAENHQFVERWVIADHADRAAALIEAAAHGATLEGAVATLLERRLAAEDLGADGLAAVLQDAVFVGIDRLTDKALSTIRRHAARETDLARLGAGLHAVYGLSITDALFGAARSRALQACVVELYDRGLWLLEQESGQSSPADGPRVDAVRALRDVARDRRTGVDPTEAVAVFTRRQHADDAPPAIRGACLGALWSLGLLEDAPADASSPMSSGRTAVLAMARPLTLGDFLAGLFALAREEVSQGDDVIAVVDEVLAGLPEEDFLIALPSLRLAFSFFPPRERALLAQRIGARRGASSSTAASLLRLEVSAEVIAEGRRRCDEVERRMQALRLSTRRRQTASSTSSTPPTSSKASLVEESP